MGIVLEGADPHPGVFATCCANVLRDPAPISFGVFTKFDVLREALRGAKSTTFGGGGSIQALRRKDDGRRTTGDGEEQWTVGSG